MRKTLVSILILAASHDRSLHFSFSTFREADRMHFRKLRFSIALMVALFPHFVFASFPTTQTYTLRENEKHIKWLFDRRVFKLDTEDTYYLYGRPWKKSYTHRGRYSNCEADHSDNFRGLYLACPVNHFKYARSYTMCFVCNYSFVEHFQWTQKHFFVRGIGQFDGRKNAEKPYVSRILGEGLERMERWKSSTSRLKKDFNPNFAVTCQHGCNMGFP